MGARITPRKGVGTLPKFVRVASTKAARPAGSKTWRGAESGSAGGRTILIYYQR